MIFNLKGKKNQNSKIIYFKELPADRNIEKEYAKLDIGWDLIDKVTQEKGYLAYKDLKIDEQIKFCLFTKKILILGKDWRIEHDNEEIKQFVEENLNELEPTLFNIFWNILSAIDYGFSVSEILWKKENGKILLKGIRTVAPWQVEFEYDDYGNLRKLYVAMEEVPINKFLILSYFPEFGNLKGFPELASAWNPYFFKKMVQKFWLKHLERFGSPIVKGMVPATASEEEVDKFFQDLNRLHFQTGIILPRGKTESEKFDFELLESKREGGSQFYDAMEYSDNRIAKAFLLPNLFGATSIRFGSYALAEKQFEVVYRVVGALQKNLVQLFNKKVIKPLVNYNFKVEKYPKFEFIPYTKEELVEIIKGLLQNKELKETISGEEK